MRQRRIVLHPYLEQELLERIHAAVGADLPFDEQENKDVVDEDVAWSSMFPRRSLYVFVGRSLW